jgi:hypothetical protein
VDRPFPGVPVRDVPAGESKKKVSIVEYKRSESTLTKKDLNVIEKKDEPVSEQKNPLFQHPDLPARKVDFEKKENPLFLHPDLPGRKGVYEKVDNPVYGNDTLDEILSPGRKVKEIANPIYGNESLGHDLQKVLCFFVLVFLFFAFFF